MRLRVRELTPRGAGAVSVLCFEGPDAHAAVAALANGRRFALGSVSLARLRLADELVDEALVCALSSECVEIHVHGSAPLLRRMLAAHASAAESSTAVATHEERCLARLAQARSPAAARILLDQAEGALRRELVALTNASPAECAARVADLVARAPAARRALEAARVVLAGTVNSGKSTLFNAVCAERRAIESPEPGTTRDVLCAAIELGAYPALLFDTAGERELEQASGAARIEGAGQERARLLRSRADLVLWLEPDPQRTIAPAASARCERITSQADRLPAAVRQRAPTPLSARDDPSGARATITRLFHDALGLSRAPWASGRAELVDDELVSALALPDPSAAVQYCLELLGPPPRGLSI